MEMQSQTQTQTCIQGPLPVDAAHLAVVTEQMMETFSGAGHVLGVGSGMQAVFQRLMAIMRQHLTETFTAENWKLIWPVLLQQLVADGYDINTAEGQRCLTNMAIVVMTRSVQARLEQELQNLSLPQDEIVRLRQLVVSVNACIAADDGCPSAPSVANVQATSAAANSALHNQPQMAAADTQMAAADTPPNVGTMSQVGLQHPLQSVPVHTPPPVTNVQATPIAGNGGWHHAPLVMAQSSGPAAPRIASWAPTSLGS